MTGLVRRAQGCRHDAEAWRFSRPAPGNNKRQIVPTEKKCNTTTLWTHHARTTTRCQPRMRCRYWRSTLDRVSNRGSLCVFYTTFCCLHHIHSRRALPPYQDLEQHQLLLGTLVQFFLLTSQQTSSMTKHTWRSNFARTTTVLFPRCAGNTRRTPTTQHD